MWSFFVWSFVTVVSTKYQQSRPIPPLFLPSSASVLDHWANPHELDACNESNQPEQRPAPSEPLAQGESEAEDDPYASSAQDHPSPTTCDRIIGNFVPGTCSCVAREVGWEVAGQTHVAGGRIWAVMSSSAAWKFVGTRAIPYLGWGLTGITAANIALYCY